MSGAGQRPGNVTGRDSHLISSALATAYAVLERLPPRCRAASDMEDIDLLMRTRLGEGWRTMPQYPRYPLDEAEWETGSHLNLPPRPEGDAA